MSTRKDEPVFWYDGAEPEMQYAARQARATFRFIWRELSWERRRIVPALDLAAVKTVFADRPIAESNPKSRVEQMWLDGIVFNGHTVTGKLLNQPNWLKSVKQGDTCSFPFEQLTDWMFASRGRVYGAFTVNLIRSRMKPPERQAHDEAWGLNFGDPSKILLSYPDQTDPADETQHPMSVNTRLMFQEELKKNPAIMNELDDRGWTLLHHESLAGNASMVEILLQHGADRSLQTKDGDLAIDLARLMRWQKIVSMLST